MESITQHNVSPSLLKFPDTGMIISTSKFPNIPVSLVISHITRNTCIAGIRDGKAGEKWSKLCNWGGGFKHGRQYWKVRCT